MDQSKTGKFIAESRRAQNLTQRQLADQLAISDKTVSKWECGKGMPEISLMLPLCQILQITVNDLLSGEKVAEGDYQKKAEENLMDLMKENAENKERITLCVICGVITIIAFTSLTVLAAYVEMPLPVRILLVVLAVATAAVGLGAAARLEVKAGHYECPCCGALFVPTWGDYVKGVHTLTRRRLTCPICGKTSMCRHRITR